MSSRPKHQRIDWSFGDTNKQMNKAHAHDPSRIEQITLKMDQFGLDQFFNQPKFDLIHPFGKFKSRTSYLKKYSTFRFVQNRSYQVRHGSARLLKWVCFGKVYAVSASVKELRGKKNPFIDELLSEFESIRMGSIICLDLMGAKYSMVMITFILMYLGLDKSTPSQVLGF